MTNPMEFAPGLPKSGSAIGARSIRRLVARFVVLVLIQMAEAMRIGVEFVDTVLRTEIERLARVLARSKSRLGINFHTANRIFDCHGSSPNGALGLHVNDHGQAAAALFFDIVIGCAVGNVTISLPAC